MSYQFAVLHNLRLPAINPSALPPPPPPPLAVHLHLCHKHQYHLLLLLLNLLLVSVSAAATVIAAAVAAAAAATAAAAAAGIVTRYLQLCSYSVSVSSLPSSLLTLAPVCRDHSSG